jgi:elongator complex protein 1
MRNISVQCERKRSLKHYVQDQKKRKDSEEAVLLNDDDGIAELCVFHEDDTIVLLTRAGSLFLLNDNDHAIWQVDLNSRIKNNESSSEWFNLTFVEPHLIALNRNGTILALSLSDGTSELVGEFEHGIHAAAWNADRTVLVLITSIRTSDESASDQYSSVLLSLNSEFDVLSEVSMEQINDYQSNPVSVCWSDSRFAVNAVDRADGLRKIRIYSSPTLDLLAIGRTEDGSGTLAPNLQYSDMAWAGSGCSHLLTAVQKKGRKTLVAFFEPNGLRHREFVLREDNTVVVRGLSWNATSDLLAVSLQLPNMFKVQLWHRSNYHWYMKFEWRYEAVGQCRVMFHPQDPCRLYILLDHLRWCTLTIRWDVATFASNNIAMVVDGNTVHQTVLERAVIPPPMSESVLTLDAPVREIVLNRTDAIYDGVISLSNGHWVVIRRQDVASVPSIRTVVVLRDSGHWDVASFRHLTILRSEHDARSFWIAIATLWEEPSMDFLVEMTIIGEEATISGWHRLALPCWTITTWSGTMDGALIQFEDGSLQEYAMLLSDDLSWKGQLTPCFVVDRLLEPCPWVAAIRKHGSNGISRNDRLIIGMSTKGRLYCNDFQVSDLISSFSISRENDFLCFISANSGYMLHFVPLHDLFHFDPLLGSDVNVLLHGYEPRNVERGSLLVAILSTKPSVVLQMPRGNIEVVNPRALVLRHAMFKTNDKCYKEALELMRRQKVDLNLIVDMNPSHFLENGGVTTFIEQVENIDHLNLFISSLQNWDSTLERYPIPHWIESLNTGRASSDDCTDKVNKVCLALRSVMTEAQQKGQTTGGRPITDSHFLLPILSTFAKENPPRLENALALIRDNAIRKHHSSAKKPPLFSESAQNSIQYLAFMADYELLFQTALGLYDYDMARAVARNSQMDPKSYLPLLQFYRGLPLYFGRYQVDLKLKRYELALRNLFDSRLNGEVVSDVEISQKYDGVNGNTFEDCLRLMEEHHLHRLGLELCEDKLQRNRIYQSLGDHLLVEKKSSLALSVFLAADPIDEGRCLKAAKESRNWPILFALPSVRHDAQKTLLLAKEVTEDLVAYNEANPTVGISLENAARVLLDYGNDVSGAVHLLIKAESWSEGRRIAVLHNRDDLVSKVIDAAISFGHMLIADFDERVESFREASLRYAEVLKIRKEAILVEGAESGAVFDTGDDASLFSVASNVSNVSMRSNASVGSTTSLSSVISVKAASSFSLTGGDDSNRHKSKYNVLGRPKAKKKKKPKGRNKILPGSEAELLGLVQTLKGNIIDSNLLRKVGATIVFLVQNDNVQVARELYDSYESLVKVVHDSSETRVAELQKSIHIGRNGVTVAHIVEVDVNALACSSLPADVVDVFNFIPANVGSR